MTSWPWSGMSRPIGQGRETMERLVMLAGRLYRLRSEKWKGIMIIDDDNYDNHLLMSSLKGQKMYHYYHDNGDNGDKT